MEIEAVRPASGYSLMMNDDDDGSISHYTVAYADRLVSGQTVGPR